MKYNILLKVVLIHNVASYDSPCIVSKIYLEEVPHAVVCPTSVAM